ncbi:MAG: accessory gene regulator B family protein [Acutalibacteraceae bacterium]
MSTVINMIALLAVSLLFGNVLYFVSFLVFFYSIRLFCGGFHAKTYTRCFILTNSVYILLITLTNIISNSNIDVKAVILALLMMSAIIIFIFSPVRNVHHPYSEKKYRDFRIISRCLSAIYSVICSCIVISKYGKAAIFSALSLILVSVLIIIQKIIYMGGEKDENS